MAHKIVRGISVNRSEPAKRNNGNKRQNLSDNRTTMENKEPLFTFNWENDTIKSICELPCIVIMLFSLNNFDFDRR